MRELARELRAEGRYAALHTTCEEGEPAGDDYVRAQQGVLERLRMRAEITPRGRLQRGPHLVRGGSDREGIGRGSSATTPFSVITAQRRTVLRA